MKYFGARGMLTANGILEAVPYPHRYQSQNGQVAQNCVLYPMANVEGEGQGKFSVGPRRVTKTTRYIDLDQLAELFAINGFVELELGIRMAPLDKKKYPAGAPPRLQPRRSHITAGSAFHHLVEGKRGGISERGISEGLAAILTSMHLVLPQQYRPKARFAANSAFPVAEPQASAVDAESRKEGSRQVITLAELQRRLENNEETGSLGQEIAYVYECSRLVTQGCSDPDRYVQKTYELNAAAGYDLESEFAGERRCIEVKASTVDPRRFFLSENERKVLSNLGRSGWIYLVHVKKDDPSQGCVIEEIPDPIPRLKLEPVAYHAHLGPST